MAYVGQVEDSEMEDVVEEGGCLDDDLLGCRVGCSPGNRSSFHAWGLEILGTPWGVEE